MRKKIMPVIVAFILIILLVAGFFCVRFVQRYIPTKEPANVAVLFGAGENRTALFLNNERQESVGIYQDGETYLPVAWVNENLNGRFYWDQSENLLVYTFPDSIVYADKDTMSDGGKPLLLETEEGVYLALGLIKTYTDIRITAYDGGDVKRVYIDNNWDPLQKATLIKNASVRELGGIKGLVVLNAVRESAVTVLENKDKWTKIRTEDGYVGYVESRKLKMLEPEMLVSDFKEPEYSNISLGERVSMAWHVVTRPEANDALETLLKDAKGINVISPTWFALSDNEGNYDSLASREYVEKAHSMGIQVWVLIDNFSKNVNSEILMSSMKSRENLINNLIRDAKTYDFDGINLDVETISQKARPHYVQFIRELSIACRREGIILSVDNTVPAPYSRDYNRKEQGIVADYVIVMGYDEHTNGDEPGSVASIGFVEKGIQDTLLEVKKEKVINAIPFYTRVWKETDEGFGSEALGIAAAKKWVEENSVTLNWDQTLGQNYGELNTDEGRRLIWMEDEKSLKLKMDLIDQYELGGVAYWRLGFEPASVWDAVAPSE